MNNIWNAHCKLEYSSLSRIEDWIWNPPFLKALVGRRSLLNNEMGMHPVSNFWFNARRIRWNVMKAMRLPYLIISILLIFSGAGFLPTRKSICPRLGILPHQLRADYPSKKGPHGTRWRFPIETFRDNRRKADITKGYVFTENRCGLTEGSAASGLPGRRVMNADIVYINGKKSDYRNVSPELQVGCQSSGIIPSPGSCWSGRKQDRYSILFRRGTVFLSPVRIIDEERGNREYMLRNFIRSSSYMLFASRCWAFPSCSYRSIWKEKKEIMYFIIHARPFSSRIWWFCNSLKISIPISPFFKCIFKICGSTDVFPRFHGFLFQKLSGTECFL